VFYLPYQKALLLDSSKYQNRASDLLLTLEHQKEDLLGVNLPTSAKNKIQDLIDWLLGGWRAAQLSFEMIYPNIWSNVPVPPGQEWDRYFARPEMELAAWNYLSKALALSLETQSYALEFFVIINDLHTWLNPVGNFYSNSTVSAGQIEKFLIAVTKMEPGDSL
jgi:hypothetical protein